MINQKTVGVQMMKKIMNAFLIVLIALLIFYLYPKLSNTPQKEVQNIISLVQENKLKNLEISSSEIKIIQDMISLEKKTKADIHYMDNPKSTKDEPIIDVFFTYFILNELEKFDAYNGIIEFKLKKKTLIDWDINGVRTINKMDKQINSNGNP
jgi:hypothetical protein